MKQIAVLIVLAVASVGLCADQKAPKADKGLNGHWAPESVTMAGKDLPSEELKSMTLMLSHGKYTLKHGEQVGAGTYKVDDSEVPKTITFVSTQGEHKGKTMLGIYELEEGTLKICFDMTGKARPAKFESKPDTQSFLASYHRQAGKKKPARAAESGKGL